MTTNIAPHVPFSPDDRIVVLIGVHDRDSAEPGWWQPIEHVLELFGRFVTMGGFVESLPMVGWHMTISGALVFASFDRLPGDPSALAVLVRMLLALPRAPVAIHVRGTPAGASERALPSTPTALELVPQVRPGLAFTLEMAPGSPWLRIDVSGHGPLSPGTVQLIDARLEVWCQICRAGGLSEVGAHPTVEPGRVSMGDDFMSVVIMADALASAAWSALPNLLDQLARTGVPIASASIR